MDDALRVLRSRPPAMIVIGGSAGALDALIQLLPGLPRRLASPIVIVVHLPPESDSSLAGVLAGMCALRVCEAEDKMVATAGSIYVAPADYHLLLETDGSLALSADPPVHYSRPSIDVLFQSAALAFGDRTLAILLSGASADGAEGLARISACGGMTWVQTPRTAAVPFMPESALALVPHMTLAAKEMGDVLAAWGRAGD